MVNLLLLLGLITYSETSAISVSGEKRGNITLRCEHEDSNIDQIYLFTRSRLIDVCETEECSGRVFKEGNCDVVIKNLIFSDAGKYTLRIYYNNDQTELKYQLHIHDEVSVNMGEQLKLDVLLSEADEVQHQSRRSTDWMKVWSRSDGVQSQRISIRDRNLIINHFTARDAGTYRVLDTEGEILITVSITESKETLEHTDDTKSDAVVSWIALTVVVLLLALILTAVTLHKRLLRGYTCAVSPEALRAHNDVC
ncbi:uncharacterized protein LOC113062513 isoform X2 [Carassius auratus]|uniref:Uncharacterized protein LOC113062513 isoform X2 n=1 Tax=Carassius auratus TaxID=7957 RepID=A0A6P6LUP9_CARAU|nr:uncharacterized protein LOC113062513 isoform X2 [Carassius auratus]